MACSLALALTFCGCADHPEPRSAAELPAVRVRVATVAPGVRTATEDVVGTVRAQLRATLEAKVPGRVERFSAELGARVRAGDLLVELDARELRARVEQAVAVRDRAAGDLRRYERLLPRQAVTQAEYDAVLSHRRVAEAALAEAETLLSQTRVVAPFDGVVVRKHADVGDLAAPGRPLVELEDPTRLRIEALLPETLVGRVRIGDELAVRLDALDVELSGTVAEIAPAADPASRTFPVLVDLPPEAGLRAGQFGRVAVPLAGSAALHVPASAVLRRGQLELAFVLEGDRARLRLIRTGKPLGQAFEVLSGLDPGEMVVVRGAESLVDGQPVDVEHVQP